ncbi:hypothetical protein [Hyphobacterium sp.]|uniref:hypothetical protein n=1 Tax=Hyphobacterium sp. TaxID=2004662 RepID=UPI003BACEB51
MPESPRRRGFLDRHQRVRIERARKSREGISPTAMMRLAGLVAAVLIGLAVFVGFDSERMESQWIQNLSGLDGITRPVFLGGSLLEWIIIAIVALYAVWALYRSARGQNNPDDEDPANG